ncbi:MAG: hypothetical protein QXZ38_01665 [Candidatus Micrarchaeaceae archaeon]
MGTFSIEGKELDKCENHVEVAASIVWELLASTDMLAYVLEHE